jgi:hypothetical protein
VRTKLPASPGNIHLLDVFDGENQMRHADAAERAPPLSGPQSNARVVVREISIREVDLARLGLPACGHAHNPCIGQEAELSGGNQLQVYGEPATTQRGIAAQRAM